MSQTLTGCFDGKAIIPDLPLQLLPGQRLRISIEPLDEEAYPLTRISNLSTDMGVDDLAEKHRDYARKR